MGYKYKTKFLCIGCNRLKKRDEYYFSVKNDRQYFYKYCKECHYKYVNNQKKEIFPNIEFRKELLKFVHIKLINKKFTVIDCYKIIGFYDELFPYKNFKFIANDNPFKYRDNFTHPKVMKQYNKAWIELYKFYMYNVDEKIINRTQSEGTT